MYRTANRNDRRRRRGRNPLLTAASIGIAAYGTYRLAKFAWDTYCECAKNEEEEEEKEDELREDDGDDAAEYIYFDHMNGVPHNSLSRSKLIRIRRCREEVSTTFVQFLPLFRGCIEGLELIDASKYVKELKLLRRRKRQIDLCSDTVSVSEVEEKEKTLWEEVKIRSATKFFVGCYSFTILYLLLTTQVHLLGNDNLIQEFRDNTSSDAIDIALTNLHKKEQGVVDEKAQMETHRLVLKKTYDYIFQRGIPVLAAKIHNLLSKRMSGWDMSSGKNIPFEDISDIIKSIRSGIESTNGEASNLSPLIGYIVQDTQRISLDDPIAQYILDETWDLVESSVFHSAICESLDYLFDIVSEKLREDLNANIEEDGKSLTAYIANMKQISSSFHKKTEAMVYTSAFKKSKNLSRLAFSSFEL